MNISRLRARSAGALVAAAAAASLAAASSAGAAPLRTASTTDYSTATYLQHALGLPAGDTDPAIEPVTYDRFQWLLQQSGNFAVLIGDPATDATFADRAQDAEAAAKDAGAKTVYWFDPNLSGNAKVGAVTEPSLDIRNADAITSIDASSRKKYDDAWSNLVGLYLGDGIDVTSNNVNSESATVTVVKGTGAGNDYGSAALHSTKLDDTSGGALYDYSSGSAPANVSHSFFFVYNKANTDSGHAAKIVSWIDLSAHGDSASTKTDVGKVIDKAGGASQLESVSQFAWWKSEVNAKQVTQAASAQQGASHPVLTDADASDGWRVNQITYPELADLLKSGGAKDAVILFGGTWCPNTRPVLPFVNQYAQQNGVQVYNFDTVLDGGLVGDATTSAINPLQIRNTDYYAPKNLPRVEKANPTFLYGDLVSQYLSNIKTQYDASRGDSYVQYYANGGAAAATTQIRKLQVPFLIGYQGSAINRQWIIKNAGDQYYTEYMTNWWFTNPQPSELNIKPAQLPVNAPIWSTINSQLSGTTWQTDVSAFYASTISDSDDRQYLVDGDKATVTYTPASGGAAAKVTTSSGGATDISPATLSSALAALGSSAPSNLAAAKAALINAETASPQDPALIGNLTTVVGAWGVAQTRKTTVNTAWGSPTSPNSVAGGLAAVHALDGFFRGLPGGVDSRRTVTADTVTAGTAPKITVAIANDFGHHPTGDVSLVVKQGGATVATASAAVADDAASFTLPALDAGAYAYTLSYAGDDQINAFTETGTLTVAPAPQQGGGGGGGGTTATPSAGTPTVAKPVTSAANTARVKVSKVRGVVVKAPTSRKGGKYKVSITVPKGAAAAGGKVTITLKKGKTTKKLTGRLSHGVVTVTLPKLAKGTWKVTITWPGDARYLKASVSGGSIKVIK